MNAESPTISEQLAEATYSEQWKAGFYAYSGNRLYIITEHDHSMTTVLLPSEYGLPGNASTAPTMAAKLPEAAGSAREIEVLEATSLPKMAVGRFPARQDRGRFRRASCWLPRGTRALVATTGTRSAVAGARPAR